MEEVSYLKAAGRIKTSGMNLKGFVRVGFPII
jgi:hypothetical protein